jgi:hypothetical protein
MQTEIGNIKSVQQKQAQTLQNVSSEPGYDASLLSIPPFTKPMDILELKL